MENSTSSNHKRSSDRHRHSSKRDSPSRNDGHPKHHHHKTHKKRRRRSRSHSFSDSLSPIGRKNPVVYMNPAFQSTYSGSGGSTQSDFELRTTLISQLSASEQRISSLESELRAAQLARGRAEQTVFDVNAEKLRLEAQNSEILQVMKTLERAVEDLQKTCGGLRAECDRRRRDAENGEKTIISCKEQNKFLNERNMKLVKKCEELCEENKAFLSRRDESTKELAEMRPRFEGLQGELRQRVEEGRKMVAQLRSYEEKERIWKKEKADLEKRIEIKDAMAAAERKNNDEWKKRHLTEKAELERKVKLAEPEIRRALDAETIKNAIEDIRAFYEQKLELTLNELNTFKKKHSKTAAVSSSSSANLQKCRPMSAPPVCCIPPSNAHLSNGLPSVSSDLMIRTHFLPSSSLTDNDMIDNDDSSHF
ncbi:Uncharacterized protein BM_BM9964 [Brugia malayi]|uniref:Bm9964 n=3 Tax=Brugia TaxID=6278 RepID=A0A0K0K141_BRUMA|nr:Uncharacterized protein BM_BM9964 [Brugia malayi]CRZ24486.1 Bm9964 [Brugia malayi]VIO98481.1 Uncharacterized protein BM_BM9964 [Brugia malayi]